MIAKNLFHTPVLLPRVIDELNVESGKKYIDATLGGGGYSEEILKLGGIVLGIDQDQDAIDFVRQKYQISNIKYQINKDIFLEHGNFRDLKEIAHSYGFNQVAGIIFDLGMSSYQLKKSGRGFSFKRNEPLDMRMDKRSKVKAADIINSYSKEELYEIFTKYAEELSSGPIAEAVVRARSVEGKIKSSRRLAEIIESVVGKSNATKARIFQALRIKVNQELESLKNGLSQAIDLLEGGGKVLVLSYHSLEDRIVKLIFKELGERERIKVLTLTPIVPDREEMVANPKSRSAKLRIAQKFIWKEKN